MELLLKSKPTELDKRTRGELFLDGVFECLTLEDAVREIPGKPVSEWKIDKKTAIPSGRYQIKMTMSGRFGRVMIQIMDVEGFKGIRIHSGMTELDTEGCPLVGDTLTAEGIAGGKNHGVLERLENKIHAALNMGEEVWITVERAND